MKEQNHVNAYTRMLHAAHEYIEKAEEKTAPILEQALEKAKQAASDLGELSREEIDRIADYLKRDLHDAASFVQETGRDFKAWFRLDLLVIESQLLEAFLRVADRTREELAELAMRAEMHEWKSGEITGPGTLTCVKCGELLHFKEAGHIPPCPKCHGSHFRRVVED